METVYRSGSAVCEELTGELGEGWGKTGGMWQTEGEADPGKPVELIATGWSCDQEFIYFKSFYIVLSD